MTAPRRLPAPVPEAEDSNDPAYRVARTEEDVVVGDRIVRFRFAVRALHWGVALTFVACLLTGLPIWSPVFGWLATLVGGLAVCRWVHPWSGVAFAVLLLLQFLDWAAVMRFGAADWRFVRPRSFVDYMRWRGSESDVGKYNGGQKALFWLSCLAGLGMLVTGGVLWFPGEFGPVVREAAWLLHDVTFILFTLLVIGHVYLGIAEPGTFGAMIHGTVTPRWARLNHPAWFRDVTGPRVDDRGRSP